MTRMSSYLFAFLLVFAVATGCDSGGGGGEGDTAAGIDVAGGPEDTAAGDAATTPDLGPAPDLGCIPQCTGRVCGPDGCGGLCGPGCGEGVGCSELGQCVCVASCAGKQCGDDGCGGQCAPGCNAITETCSEQGQCVAGAADLTCTEYFTCALACAADETCLTACHDAIAEGGATLVDEVAACLTANCATCADIACYFECGAPACGEGFGTCFSGDKICFEIQSCVRAQCVRGMAEYATCQAGCLATGTAEGQTAYMALADCIEAQCEGEPDTNWEACRQHALNGPCGPQSSACTPR